MGEGSAPSDSCQKSPCSSRESSDGMERESCFAQTRPSTDARSPAWDRLQLGRSSGASTAAHFHDQQFFRTDLEDPAADTEDASVTQHRGAFCQDPIDEALSSALNGATFERLGRGRYKFKGQRVNCRLDEAGSLVVRQGSEWVPIHDFLQ